jgi:hypothetical protein
LPPTGKNLPPPLPPSLKGAENLVFALPDYIGSEIGMTFAFNPM